MSTTATNPPVQLGRYSVPAGDRVIYGQRILGVVRLTDIPADGTGRRYLIERELHTRHELRALLADYLQQAHRLNAIPADPACPQHGGPR